MKLLLMLVPMILFSCHNRSNQNKEHTMDKGTMVLTNTVKDVDADFFKRASSGGIMEVDLGKYAQQNAQNQRVKDFGAMMVKDHSKANQKLRSLINSDKNLVYPDTLAENRNDTTSVNDLKKKTGSDFDKAYMSQMVDDHEKDIDKFKNEAENGRNPDLKTFVINTLPILQTHLDSAKNILNGLK